MSLHTEFSDKASGEITDTIIRIEDVAVRYRVPKERIPSIKEFIIRWLKREISYHEFWALRDISLEINKGEVFGIIGPNGAGKSTLLKVIARVLKPTHGRVMIKGRIAPLLELGAGFDPELTGRENIYLNGAILGFSKKDIDKRFNRIVEFSGLHEFINAPLRTYSTGMYARLGFSVASIERPDVLIVDEILGVGDVEFQKKSFERIQSFQAEGTTILLVSHSLERVQEMCSRAIWLDHGKIISTGTANSVVSQYLLKVAEKETSRLIDERAIRETNRWGSGKMQITQTRILDENEKQRMVFQTGDKLILQMDYVSYDSIPSPIFGMAIHRQDGAHITGPNTSFAGVKLPTIEGHGRVIYTIPQLPLLDGLYYISVAITNHDDTEIFDYHDRIYPFRVVNTGTGSKERYGIIAMSGNWKYETFDK